MFLPNRSFPIQVRIYGLHSLSISYVKWFTEETHRSNSTSCYFFNETPVYMNVRIFLLSMPNYHVLVGSLSFIAGVYIDQNYNVPDIKYWAKHIGDVVNSSYPTLIF